MTTTTDDVVISPFCHLSLMVWGFANPCTGVQIAMAWFSTLNSIPVFCRPSVSFPMYCMRGTEWILNILKESLPSTSTTPLSTVLTTWLILLQYYRAIPAVAFWCVIPVIAPLALLLVFRILMLAGACWWKCTRLMTNAISWSSLLWRARLLFLLSVDCLSAILAQVVGAGPGPVVAIWPWVWVWRWTVSHLLALDGGGFDFGSGCGSGLWLSCSFSLGLGFGCCCSCDPFGSPFWIPSACCEDSRPPPFYVAVPASSFFLFSWARTALPTLVLDTTSTVISEMPAPHSTLFLWWSTIFVSISSSNSLMRSHCVSSRTVSPSSFLAILSIIWYYCVILR